MLENKLIHIACGFQDTLNPSNISDLQKDLKDKTDEQLSKLKRQIIKYGFSFPLFVWKNSNKTYSIDGHGRKFVSEKFIEDGYQFKYKDGIINKKIPVVYIDAKDKKEAKEKLLALNSSYGLITNDGLYGFLNEPDSMLAFDSLKMDLELPNIDLDFMKSPDFNSTTEEEQGKLDEKKKVECPECGAMFEPK